MQDIYLEFIKHLNGNSVEYVITGISGINYYADNASQIIFTQDYDVFINPVFGQI